MLFCAKFFQTHIQLKSYLTFSYAQDTQFVVDAVTRFEIDGSRTRFCSPLFYSVTSKSLPHRATLMETCSAEGYPAKPSVTCALNLCGLAASYYESLQTFPGVHNGH